PAGTPPTRTSSNGSISRGRGASPRGCATPWRGEDNGPEDLQHHHGGAVSGHRGAPSAADNLRLAGADRRAGHSAVGELAGARGQRCARVFRVPAEPPPWDILKAEMGRYVVKLPDIGEGTTEAEIVAWHVMPGQEIREEDPLVD